jgi:hypothetical protein
VRTLRVRKRSRGPLVRFARTAKRFWRVRVCVARVQKRVCRAQLRIARALKRSCALHVRPGRAGVRFRSAKVRWGRVKVGFCAEPLRKPATPARRCVYPASPMRRALAISCALVAVSAPALATPSAHLVYSRGADASSCPDEDAMRRAVAKRFGYDPFFAWAKQTVIVQIFRGGDRYRSRVQVVNSHGVAQGTRELSSDRDACDELFDATALAISIALDAAAKTETDPGAPPLPAETAAPAPPPAPAPSAPPPHEPAPAPTPQPAPAPEAPGPVVFTGLEVLGSVGTAPATSLGGAAFLGLRSGWLSAALELRADAPATGTFSGLRITAWLYSAGLAPCVHFGPGSACLLASVGQVVGSSPDTVTSSSGSALIALVGARLGGELPLFGTFALRLHADLLTDVIPPTLRLNQSAADAWTAPVIAATLGAGLVVRFP